MNDLPGMIFAYPKLGNIGGNMISLHRIPSNVDSSSWRRRNRNNVPDSDEAKVADFDELFQAVSENSEISLPLNRKPFAKQQGHPGKKSKLDLSV